MNAKSCKIITINSLANTTFFFCFSYGELQLILPEVPQPYGLLYYPHIGLSNFLHQFHAAMLPKQRRLELQT
jgi:hypothetical protein